MSGATAAAAADVNDCRAIGPCGVGALRGAFMVRRFDRGRDLDTLRAWLVAWEMIAANAVVPAMPPFGVVATEEGALVAAAFLSETDMGVAMIVNGIADRVLPHHRRRQALRACLLRLEQEADRRRVPLVAQSTRPSVVDLFRELGWSTAERGLVGLVRPVGGV